MEKTISFFSQTITKRFQRYKINSYYNMQMIKTLKILRPEEFRVLKLYSFRDPVTGFPGYVYYLRPKTESYSKTSVDEFDVKFMDWLKAMNLNNVAMAHSEVIFYEGQLEYFMSCFQVYKRKDKMFLTCHGDYTVDEIMAKKEIAAFVIDLNMYWNARETDIILSPGGTFTFDKNREKYFMDVFNSITI